MVREIRFRPYHRLCHFATEPPPPPVKGAAEPGAGLADRTCRRADPACRRRECSGDDPRLSGRLVGRLVGRSFVVVGLCCDVVHVMLFVFGD